ncbi:hypothetical protein HaLaN_15462, partial [Haematococcus lacustris]
MGANIAGDIAREQAQQ